MTSIREISDKLWNGDLDTQEIHPIRFQFRDGEELDEGLLFYKGLAAATTVDTGDGLVMLDTGSVGDMRQLHETVRAWRPDAPLRHAVFSHHHVDHIFGVGRFEVEARERGWTAPLAIGHRLIRRNFDRYKVTGGWNRAINVRQFAIPVAPPNDGGRTFEWQTEYRYPDVEYDDQLRVTCGDITLEMKHARGETEDATWTWIPERKALFPGDLFIWAVPNAGNPQKVQRYLQEWAVALREMAALGAELMIPGHGVPIFGTERINQALTDTADLLESIESQTLALMNTGASLDCVIHEVEVPATLRDQPYLQAVYDHPEFLVRNVWRLYGGWHDGEPDNLLPAPRAQQASEWVALAGGVERVLERATELLEAGELQLACHIIEFAVLAEPGSRDAHVLRGKIYTARSEEQTSSMAKNILGHAALASSQGKRDLFA